MRALALSVFTQCRRTLTHTSNVKALTGFGTAAMTDLFLKNKDVSTRYYSEGLLRERVLNWCSFA
jgi:mediator of RNA polymerase II transcription subunit 13